MALRLRKAATVGLWLVLAVGVLCSSVGCAWSVGTTGVGLQGYWRVDENIKMPAFDWLVAQMDKDAKDKEPSNEGAAKEGDIVSDGSEPIHIE